jgi:hypothetical protein
MASCMMVSKCLVCRRKLDHGRPKAASTCFGRVQRSYIDQNCHSRATGDHILTLRSYTPTCCYGVQRLKTEEHRPAITDFTPLCHVSTRHAQVLTGFRSRCTMCSEWRCAIAATISAAYSRACSSSKMPALLQHGAVHLDLAHCCTAAAHKISNIHMQLRLTLQGELHFITPSKCFQLRDDSIQ